MLLLLLLLLLCERRERREQHASEEKKSEGNREIEWGTSLFSSPPRSLLSLSLACLLSRIATENYDAFSQNQK
jgi:hypothetical protein